MIYSTRLLAKYMEDGKSSLYIKWVRVTSIFGQRYFPWFFFWCRIKFARGRINILTRDNFYSGWEIKAITWRVYSIFVLIFQFPMAWSHTRRNSLAINTWDTNLSCCRDWLIRFVENTQRECMISFNRVINNYYRFQNYAETRRATGQSERKKIQLDHCWWMCLLFLRSWGLIFQSGCGCVLVATIYVTRTTNYTNWLEPIKIQKSW